MKRMLTLIVLAGCAEVPANPSYQLDVQPILAANCARCHQQPPQGGAPLDFYLRYQETDPADWAQNIATRVVAGEMPPRRELGDYEVEVIERWAAQGGQRGAARPDNRLPVASLPTVDGLRVTFELHDPDGDLVGGNLLVDGISVAELQQGRTTIVLTPGRHDLAAFVDDGAGYTTVDIATVMVMP